MTIDISHFPTYFGISIAFASKNSIVKGICDTIVTSSATDKKLEIYKNLESRIKNLILSSSTINKKLENFEFIFEFKIAINFEFIFEIFVNFEFNFEIFVNGR